MQRVPQIPPDNAPLTPLPREAWMALEARHDERIGAWVRAHQARRSRNEVHPVFDFLFDYYQANRHTLVRWRPPVGYELEGEEASKFLEGLPCCRGPQGGVHLDMSRFTAAHRERASWIADLLRSALSRRPFWGCFGLHEWAMVYRAEAPRHRTPLRLPLDDISRIVESHPVACSHYDAFRFFTPAARPLNTIQPLKEERFQNEQTGCVHFNMDLYKWCYKLAPWSSSERTAECFEMALEARILDMRASPYDLAAYGYSPIPIETPEGKTAYIAEQQRISQKGRELALKLLDDCTSLLARSAVTARENHSPERAF